MNHVVYVRAQEGCISLITRHLSDIDYPTEVYARKSGESAVLALVVSGEDIYEAVDTVREHLAPVCGVEGVW